MKNSSALRETSEPVEADRGNFYMWIKFGKRGSIQADERPKGRHERFQAAGRKL